MSSNYTLFSVEGVTRSNRVLHTPSTFARTNLLYVQEVGELKSLCPHVCRRENLKSYLILIVLNGQGSVKTNGHLYELREGDCAFLDCMNLYEHLSSKEDPWELMWVHFYGNNAEVYYRLFQEKNDNRPVFRPSNKEKVEESIKEILFLKDEKDLMSELKAALQLTTLLTICVSDVTGEVRLEEVREFINKNYCEKRLVEMMCNRYNKDETELNEVFYKNYGIELRDYILVRRFTVAKELLRFTIKDISIIIEESGIGNEDLFRQLFKENEGMSAEEYRMKWAQWIKN